MALGKTMLLPLIILGALFSFLAFASASVTWDSYGNGFSPLFNSEYGGGTGNLETFTNITKTIPYAVTNGVLKEYQPIVFNFQSPADSNPVFLSQNYLAIPTTNYLQIYNKDFTLFQEISTGTNTVGQININDFDQDGMANEVTGVWYLNASSVQYRAYEYNITTNALRLTYTYNITANSTSGIVGVRRCSSGTDCFIKTDLASNGFNNTFYTINKTNVYSVALAGTKTQLNKPLAFTDMDADGKTEYMSNSLNDVLIFRNDGTTVQHFIDTTANHKIRDSGMLLPDLTNNWKFYYLLFDGTNTASINARKIDGSVYWTKSYISSNYQTGAIAVTPNYESVTSYNCTTALNIWFIPITTCTPYTSGNDLYVIFEGSAFTSIYTNYLTTLVLRGSDGVELTNNATLTFQSGGLRYFAGSIDSASPTLTLANMDAHAQADFIITDPINNSIIVVNENGKAFLQINSTGLSSSGVPLSCVPVDLGLTGSLGLSCAGSIKSEIFYSNMTNQNPVLTSVDYYPSSSTDTATPILIYPHATDLENDVIIYAYKCYTGDTLKEQTYTPISCSYAQTGFYETFVGVRDSYHATYNNLSQITITVYNATTPTPNICNNNGVCNAGETVLNCPNDCKGTGGGNGTDGKVIITYDLVDTNDTSKGLLPEVYLAIITFFSYALVPLLMIFGAIALVLIIIGIAGVFVAIAHKVGDLGG